MLRWGGPHQPRRGQADRPPGAMSRTWVMGVPAPPRPSSHRGGRETVTIRSPSQEFPLPDPKRRAGHVREGK